MGFLSDLETSSLSIKQMILHVVGGKDPFVPQPLMDGLGHIDFFRARILDTAIDGVHRFEEKSETKALLGKIGAGALGFESGGQELSRRFSNDHVGSSRDGAFFVFELGTNNSDVTLFSMIKYDYAQAVELYAKDGKNALRQIVQAFVRERRAIQKSCLVRVINGVVQNQVSAIDRMGDAPDLTDYFQKFLEVVRDRDTNELSQRLNEVLRATLQNCKLLLPAQDVPAALAATKSHLRGRANVDDDAIREAIFVAADRSDDEARAELDKVLTRQLRDKKLAGVRFKPDPRTLARPARRKLRTVEGVTLEYPGEQEDRAVARAPAADGGWTITIKTRQKLVEDVVLPDRIRPED